VGRGGEGGGGAVTALFDWHCLNVYPDVTPRFPAGKILTDDFADKEGLEMGDEYFANLDHIESVEKYKEGYESDAKCSSDSSGVDLKEEEPENTGSEAESSSSDSSDQNFGGNDDAYVPSSVWRSYVTRTKSREQKENGSEAGLARQTSQEEATAANATTTTTTAGLPASFTEETAKNKVASWLSALRVEDPTATVAAAADSDSRSSFKLAEGAPKEEEGGQPDAKRPPKEEAKPPKGEGEAPKEEAKPAAKAEGERKEAKFEPTEVLGLKVSFTAETIHLQKY